MLRQARFILLLMSFLFVACTERVEPNISMLKSESKFRTDGPYPTIGGPATEFMWLVEYPPGYQINLSPQQVIIHGDHTVGCTTEIRSKGQYRQILMRGCNAPSAKINIEIAANSATRGETEAPMIVGFQPVTITGELLINLSSSSSTTTPLSSSSIGIDIDFSNPVRNFDARFLTLQNARLLSLEELSNNKKRVKIEPLSDGTVAIELAAHVFNDDYGNLNPQKSISFISDRTPPSIRVTSQNSSAIDEAPSWIVDTNDQTPFMLDSSKLKLQGAIADCLMSFSSISPTSEKITALGCTELGEIRLQVELGYATDTAGNISAKITSAPTLRHPPFDDSALIMSWSTGDSGYVSKNKPSPADELTSYQQISLGSTHTCGLTPTGALKCWGNNYYGQLAISSSETNSPVPLTVAGNYSYVSLGDNHTCAINTTGRLQCWGLNYEGQVGNGNKYSNSAPEVIDSPERYTQVALGVSHTCGITTSSSLKCWGQNSSGQLGIGNSNESLTPTLVADGAHYQQVALSHSHTCGLTIAGEIKCWGDNSAGQLGNGTTTSSLVPIAIDSGESYSFLATANNRTCGITQGGALKCWGNNFNGRLGDGTTIDRSLPVVIDNGVTYKRVAMGYDHTCGITFTGTVKCWGENYYGQLGNETTANSFLPRVIKSESKYSSISVGFRFTCGITVESALQCWGWNISGQLGDRDSSQNQTRLQLPLTDDVTYDFYVDWGDGNIERITDSSLSKAVHFYHTPGVYDIKMLGLIPRLTTSSPGVAAGKLLNLRQWGANPWTSMEQMFKGAKNLTITATDAPDLSRVTSMKSMFAEATEFNSNINHWNTVNIKDMSFLFEEALKFNQPLDAWNTSNVITMADMFNGASVFNQPIGNWDTSKVTNMSFMFHTAKSFNKSIGAWKTGNVTNMSYMFGGASAFNQNISAWDTAKVKNMNYMFYYATSFNQNLSSWNVDAVTSYAAFDIGLSGIWTLPRPPFK